MIKSMTGYGSAKGLSKKIELSIELRGVNNRYLDTNIRMPRIYTAIEDNMKELIQKHISRGKIDVYLTVDSSTADDVVITVNHPLANAYIMALEDLASKYDIKNDITALSLSKFPDILHVEKEEADMDALSADICGILEVALNDFDSMRIREGKRLHEDIIGRITEIERLTALAEQRSPKAVAEYKEKLLARLTEVLQNFELDESRILFEAAVFADKVAINEEIVRLRSHISQLREMLESTVPVGRKLDFLIQELNREANTIGSKGNDSEMAQIVVNMKAEIEKIREQVQNIE